MKTDNFQLANSQEPGAVEDGLWPDPHKIFSVAVRRLAAVLVGERKKRAAAKAAGVPLRDRPGPRKYLNGLPFDERHTLYALREAARYLIDETKWPKGLRSAVETRCRQLKREERIMLTASNYLRDVGATVYLRTVVQEVWRRAREHTTRGQVLALLEREFGGRLIRRNFGDGPAVKLER